MKHLRVTNIQRGCVYDGPGVRTTVFLKGCPLRCPWCCNPETQSYEEDFFVNDDKCLLYKGNHSMMCVNCERCGGIDSIIKCPLGVCERTSIDYETKELLAVLLQDYLLYQESNGGVTFSGGEPLMQVEALYDLIGTLHAKGINVVVETSLYSKGENLSKLIPFVDYWIVDFKLQPQTNLDSEDYFNIVMNNYSELRDRDVINRLVFVNEMNVYKGIIVSKLQGIGVDKVEVILGHNLGKIKYKKLRKEYNDINATIEEAAIFVKYLEYNNITTSFLTL